MEFSGVLHDDGLGAAEQGPRVVAGCAAPQSGLRTHHISGIPSFRERPDFGAFRPSRRANGEPQAPHLSWRDLSLDDCETRTRTSGLVIRDSPHQNANLQLHFGSRKNEGMAEMM